MPSAKKSKNSAFRLLRLERCGAGALARDVFLYFVPSKVRNSYRGKEAMRQFFRRGTALAVPSKEKKFVIPSGARLSASIASGKGARSRGISVFLFES